MHILCAATRFRPMRLFAGSGCGRAMLCKGQEPIRKPQSVQHGCTVLRTHHNPPRLPAFAFTHRCLLGSFKGQFVGPQPGEQLWLPPQEHAAAGNASSARRARPASAHQEQNASPCQSPATRKAQRITGTAWPNTSFKRSANGRPPGPRYSAGVHFLQRGPGALPSSPA